VSPLAFPQLGGYYPLMTSRTSLQRLADNLLGRSLDDYVGEARAAGKSWRQIEIQLHDEIQLDVYGQTLRSWYPQWANVPPKRKRRRTA
jgi:hypothetical protein